MTDTLPDRLCNDPRSPYYDPDFPKPIRLGKRAVGWRESEVIAWLESRERTTA